MGVDLQLQYIFLPYTDNFAAYILELLVIVLIVFCSTVYIDIFNFCLCFHTYSFLLLLLIFSATAQIYYKLENRIENLFATGTDHATQTMLQRTNHAAED